MRRSVSSLGSIAPMRPTLAERPPEDDRRLHESVHECKPVRSERSRGRPPNRPAVGPTAIKPYGWVDVVRVDRSMVDDGRPYYGQPAESGDREHRSPVRRADIDFAVVLIAAESGRPREVLGVGTVCGVLTILSFFLTREGAFASGVANCVLSLVAIGTSTFLAIKINAAALAARQAQADLARLSRVMVVGELTTSIAHEVSQPLAAIAADSNAALRWLSRSPPNQDEARRALERVTREANRAGTVIARVRQLVRRAPPCRESVDLDDAITAALGLLRDQIRANRISLRTDLPNDLPTVSGDRVQLQQVVLNLLLNGIEAMLGIEAERELVVTAAVDERHGIVSVADVGVGVPPEAADRIFETFYTSKPEGIGIGLSISRSIIEAHGGMIFMSPQGSPRHDI